MTRTWQDYIDDFLVLYVISFAICLVIMVAAGLWLQGAFTLAFVFAIPATLVLKYVLQQEIIK